MRPQGRPSLLDLVGTLSHRSLCLWGVRAGSNGGCVDIWLGMPFLYRGSRTSSNSGSNWNRLGVPEPLTFRAPCRRHPQCFTVTRGHSFFFKRLLFETTFFFLPSKLMGNTLSQRESQHFERLQHCTQTTQESSPTLVWGGWQGGRGKGQKKTSDVKCYPIKL